MKGLPLRRPETNMRCLLTSWDRCGVKSAIILEQTYWWTITGAASSLRSQTTILCRQSSWILWTPENLPHPGSTLVWRQFFFLLQVSYIFGDMSEYVLIKLKQDWSALSRQKRFPIIHLLPCIFLAFASNIFVSYHPGVLHICTDQTGARPTLPELLCPTVWNCQINAQHSVSLFACLQGDNV